MKVGPPPLLLADSSARQRTSHSNAIATNKDQTVLPPINTPYSIERQSSRVNDDLPYTPLIRHTSPASLPTQQRRSLSTTAKMSTQPPHASLLIPGPIEITDEVSQSMAHYAQSHVGPPFVSVFGDTLALVRDLFQTKNPKSQPFIIAGSGTLGWDLAAANLIEPGDEVLVLHSGYFADSFADAIQTYGGKPTQLKAPIGQHPQPDEIEKALKERKYKAVTITHVDTSTGVLSPIQPVADVLRKVSPDTLLIVDGVCSVGAEELDFDKNGIDFALTASQKAIGCPPGLSISVASERAIETFKSRKQPPGSYYASFKNWVPIMQNYEAKKPSYFATPPTQLIQALHTALKQLHAGGSLQARFEQHQKISQKVKKAVAELGLKQLPVDPSDAANTMTAIWLPEGWSPPDILPKLLASDVVFAGGLHKEIATKYIRFGHMGASATDESRGDIDKALDALKKAVAEVRQAKGQ
ncbi:hypothetical protein DV738_g1267, partial [Chaetothyriales sp. CBS 135597]